MSVIYVIDWCGSVNTEMMADAVAEVIHAAGAHANVLDVASASADVIKDAKAFALGCPAMGSEQLEEGDMEPFVEELESLVSGKKILLCGSYGWGDGEWMHNWEDKCKEDGAVLVADGVICQEEPDDDAVESCKALGKALA